MTQCQECGDDIEYGYGLCKECYKTWDDNVEEGENLK